MCNFDKLKPSTSIELTAQMKISVMEPVILANGGVDIQKHK